MDFDLQLFKAGGSHGRGAGSTAPPSSTPEEPTPDIRIKRSEMDALLLMAVATVSSNSIACSEQVMKDRPLTKEEQESVVLAHVLLERIKVTFQQGGVVEDTNDPLDKIIDEALGG